MSTYFTEASVTKNFLFLINVHYFFLCHFGFHFAPFHFFSPDPTFRGNYLNLLNGPTLNQIQTFFKKTTFYSYFGLPLNHLYYLQKYSNLKNKNTNNLKQQTLKELLYLFLRGPQIKCLGSLFCL